MTNLIPIAYLQEVCFVSQNIPQEKFQALLEMAQDDLKVTLNKPLYDEIIAQFSTTPKTLSTANTSLYEYIKKYLAWQTYFYFQKFANFTSTPTGNREFTDDNSDLLSDVKNYSLEKNIKERSVFYRYEMINFLKESRINDVNSYPLWVDQCREEMSFAITSVDGKSDIRNQIFTATRSNE